MRDVEATRGIWEVPPLYTPFQKPHPISNPTRPLHFFMHYSLSTNSHQEKIQFDFDGGRSLSRLELDQVLMLEFDLAMKGNDLKRALQCLLTMSNSRDVGHEIAGTDVTEILSLAAKQENLADVVQGIVKFAKEFMDLIDAADATAQADIACEALKRLAAAGSVKGALRGQESRGVALRLANHGELTRLGASGTYIFRLDGAPQTAAS